MGYVLLFLVIFPNLLHSGQDLLVKSVLLFYTLVPEGLGIVV